MKGESQSKELLIYVITKITILTFFSLFFAIFHMITTMLYILYTNNFNKYFDGYITLIDVFGNNMCGLLCFINFKKQYNILCKCFHLCCRKFWTNFIKICYKSELNIINLSHYQNKNNSAIDNDNNNSNNSNNNNNENKSNITTLQITKTTLNQDEKH